MNGTLMVTGAFGYSGSYIAERLLAEGRRVRTLTRSPSRSHALAGSVEVFPLDFENADGLARALEGVDVLYNTYWVRFSRAGFSQTAAVANTRRLFAAAASAGVRRVVHVSITNPSRESPWEYFRGKAQLEESLGECGIAHSILRPAVLFGGADILINNIAWMLRRFPLFGVFGTGEYELQPIHVDDFAELAVLEGRKDRNRVVDAVGPETYTYRELVREIGLAIGKERPIVSVPRYVGRAVAEAIGLVVRDVVLTREEIGALMDGLLATGSTPTGTTRLSAWMRSHADELGVRYASELARRRDRRRPYAALSAGSSAAARGVA